MISAKWALKELNLQKAFENLNFSIHLTKITPIHKFVHQDLQGFSKITYFQISTGEESFQF
jgi:hypothetical protein